MAVMTTTTMMIVIHRKTRVHNAQSLSFVFAPLFVLSEDIEIFSVCFLEYGLID